jgi:hypothetical protein
MRSESIWRKRAGPGRLSSHFTAGEISNLIKNPLPPTHPPLRLRIYKILRESGKTHQKVGES